MFCSSCNSAVRSFENPRRCCPRVFFLGEKNPGILGLESEVITQEFRNPGRGGGRPGSRDSWVLGFCWLLAVVINKKFSSDMLAATYC